MLARARQIKFPFWLAAVLASATGWGSAWGADCVLGVAWMELTDPGFGRLAHMTTRPWLQNLIGHCRVLNFDVPIWAAGFGGALLLAVLVHTHRPSLIGLFAFGTATAALFLQLTGWYWVYIPLLVTQPPFPLELTCIKIILVLLASLLGGVLGAKLARRHRSDNRCTSCEYDLTGNESGVCPECGTRIEPSPEGAEVNSRGRKPSEHVY